jgi:hypothetical protein
MPSQKIGEINGKWAFLFKVLLVINATVIVPALGWNIWITKSIIDLSYRSGDRWTGAMAIETQDELTLRNPSVKWLNAADIRKIQNGNFKYLFK